jgi:hypothetical protein
MHETSKVGWDEAAGVHVAISLKDTIHRSIVGSDEHDSLVFAFHDDLHNCSELDTAPDLQPKQM